MYVCYIFLLVINNLNLKFVKRALDAKPMDDCWYVSYIFIIYKFNYI